MHAGLGCRRGTRAVPFSVSHALPYTVKKSSFKRRVHFRSAEMCGQTNGFSDQRKKFSIVDASNYVKIPDESLKLIGY